MRTTFDAMHRNATAGLERSSERMLEYQRQVSTGRRLERPSDDPSAAATSVAEHSGIATIERYTRAADSVNSRLTVVDTVLSDVIVKLTAAQSAIVSVRGSIASDAQRDAAAQELLSLRDALAEDFNTSFRGTYLFSGAATTTQPYAKNPDGTIAAYAGAASEVALDVADGRAVAVAYEGEAIVRGSDTVGLFETLDAAAAAARAGDEAGLQASLDALQRAFERATTAQSRVGAGLRTIDDERIQLAQMKVAAERRVSSLEDANMAEAITRMAQADAAYRAALGAAGALSKLSLMDYLK